MPRALVSRPQQIVQNGRIVNAVEKKSARLSTKHYYHRVAVAAANVQQAFFTTNLNTAGVAVTNMDDAGGRIATKRKFVLQAIAMDFSLVTGALAAVDLETLLQGRIVVTKNGDIIAELAARAVGSVGGATAGYVDAASAGTTSSINQAKGPAAIQEEKFEAGDIIGVRLDHAANTNIVNVQMTLIGVELFED